ncbi:MAG: GSCFA domain-containing protein [Bacteroidales bacterium]|nr:GSCFA domain-containing protein [Bacteroidales bacterium]
MILRTPVKTDPSQDKITYFTPVLFSGSCFAVETGRRMAEAKMKVLINPAGTMFNPVSVFNSIDLLLQGKSFTGNDLIFHDNLWHSFYHYTDFSSSDAGHTLSLINRSLENAREFLRQAKFLFVTFGSAMVFRFKETGMIVSNCHKMPSVLFSREMLKVEDVTRLWLPLLDRLKSFNPGLKTVFTLSPVRYLGNGAHANQVSKAVLTLAIEEILSHSSSPGYFPAYEIFMDDLRDYRFYADDMVHPSTAGADYVFNIFRQTYFSDDTEKLYQEVMEVVRARNHRIISPSARSLKIFADNILKKIGKLTEINPGLGFEEERAYFNSLGQQKKYQPGD